LTRLSRQTGTTCDRTGGGRGLPAFFPSAHLYAGLRKPPRETGIRESRDSSFTFPYSERHLQCLWFDSSFRPGKLLSSDHEEIIVENPGRWNLEAGPDFLDATIVIGPERRTVRGDVEIHIHPGDWKNHHHGGDRAYSRVIAHVCYFPGPVHEEDLPPEIISISLRDTLKSNPAFSFENIDITAYPYSSLPSRTPPCAGILSSWNPDNRALLLHAAGEERLRIKTVRIETALGDRGGEQVLYEETMAALGYKHNSTPFRELAVTLPLKTLQAESGGDAMKAYAILLGVAGLLPPSISPKWDAETRSFVRNLWDSWWKQQSKWETRRMKQDAWRMAGLRPQNSPVRRMAAAAALFICRKSAASRLKSISTAHPGSWHKKIDILFEPGESFRYWSHRLGFAGNLQKSEVALVGPDRIAAIESNVFIPFLAANGIPVKNLLNVIPPEHDNGLIRQTAYTLLGRDQNPSLYRNGLRQQGLLQIFHDFCLNNRSACRDCLLPKALKSFQDETASYRK